MAKKVAIIGAGISGMTAAHYLLDNGFEVDLYEKNHNVGGECVSWERQGQTIDGCAHWVVGTNPNSVLFPTFKHVGAFDENTPIFHSEYFAKFECEGGETFTFYGDLKKLEQEMLRVGPEDKRQIHSFIKLIRHYRHVQIPVNKPLDMMNIFELSSFGIKMVPMLFAYGKAKKITLSEYAKRFKSPVLRSSIDRLLYENYNLHAALYMLQAFSDDDASVPEGGSLAMSERIGEKLKAKGGRIHLNAPVKKVLIEGKKAKGILLESGETINADYVVCSTDTHHFFADLLDGDYMPKYYKNAYMSPADYPLQGGLLFSYSLSRTAAEKLPKMLDFPIDPVKIGDYSMNHLCMRNYSYDATLKGERVTISILNYGPETVYHYFKAMGKIGYKKRKKELLEEVRVIVRDHLGLLDEDIVALDLATPVTYERYCNAFHGSYMSFITTGKSHGLLQKGIVKGVDNLFFSGQWVMPPGGLPIALFTGKHAAIRICKKEKIKFVNKEGKE